MAMAADFYINAIKSKINATVDNKYLGLRVSQFSSAH
jgi:hypothetical protein